MTVLSQVAYLSSLIIPAPGILDVEEPTVLRDVPIWVTPKDATFTRRFRDFGGDLTESDIVLMTRRRPDMELLPSAALRIIFQGQEYAIEKVEPGVGAERYQYVNLHCVASRVSADATGVGPTDVPSPAGSTSFYHGPVTEAQAQKYPELRPGQTGAGETLTWRWVARNFRREEWQVPVEDETDDELWRRLYIDPWYNRAQVLISPDPNDQTDPDVQERAGFNLYYAQFDPYKGGFRRKQDDTFDFKRYRYFPEDMMPEITEFYRPAWRFNQFRLFYIRWKPVDEREYPMTAYQFQVQGSGYQAPVVSLPNLTITGNTKHITDVVQLSQTLLATITKGGGAYWGALVDGQRAGLFGGVDKDWANRGDPNNYPYPAGALGTFTARARAAVRPLWYLGSPDGSGSFVENLRGEAPGIYSKYSPTVEETTPPGPANPDTRSTTEIDAPKGLRLHRVVVPSAGNYGPGGLYRPRFVILWTKVTDPAGGALDGIEWEIAPTISPTMFPTGRGELAADAFQHTWVWNIDQRRGFDPRLDQIGRIEYVARLRSYRDIRVQEGVVERVYSEWTEPPVEETPAQ